MHRHDLRLAIVSDRHNQCSAKTYFKLLCDSGVYASHPRNTLSFVNFDPTHPAQTTDGIERQHAALAQVGIPGRRDYKDVLCGFLAAYAATRHKPPVGVLTHDPSLTRHVLESWPEVRHLPDGAINIVDASAPLAPEKLQRVLDILLGKRQEVSGSGSVVPFTQVRARSVNPLHFAFSHWQ